MYDIAILINLERRKDRRDKIVDHLTKRGIKNLHVYPAFDGQEIYHMTVKPPKRNYTTGQPMSKGVIGCGLSHIGAIKMGKSLGYKKILMLEDDAILSRGISAKFDILEEESKGLDWEHIFVGGALRKRNELKQVTKHLWTSSFTDGVHAYLIQNEGINKICDEMLHFNTTVDDAINDLILSKKLKSYTMLPLGAFQQPGFSDIDNRFISRTDTMQYYKDGV